MCTICIANGWSNWRIGWGLVDREEGVCYICINDNVNVNRRYPRKRAACMADCMKEMEACHMMRKMKRLRALVSSVLAVSVAAVSLPMAFADRRTAGQGLWAE